MQRENCACGSAGIILVAGYVLSQTGGAIPEKTVNARHGPGCCWPATNRADRAAGLLRVEPPFPPANGFEWAASMASASIRNH